MTYSRILYVSVFALCFGVILFGKQTTGTQGQAYSTVAATDQSGAVPTLAPNIAKKRVTFKSGDLTLVGFLYKPEGQGPFPGIIWNHGSDREPHPDPAPEKRPS